MRNIRKEKGIINGKFDYSCFFSLKVLIINDSCLNVLDDFQIRSL